LNPDP